MALRAFSGDFKGFNGFNGLKGFNVAALIIFGTKYIKILIFFFLNPNFYVNLHFYYLIDFFYNGSYDKRRDLLPRTYC